MKNRNLICLVSLFIMAAGCFSPAKISLYDLSYLYKSDKEFTNLRCQVFHTTDSLSVALVPARLSDFDYERPPYGGPYQAQYEISYQLTESYEGKVVLDSATYRYVDSVNFGKNVELIHSLEIPVNTGQNYILALQVKDLFKLEEVKGFFPIYKSNLNSQQNFMAITRARQPLFRNYVDEAEGVKIRVNEDSRSFLYVRAYFRDFPVARPPFVSDRESSFDYRADSTFAMGLVNGETSFFTLSRQGFYHFQKDSTSRQGFTLFRFYNGFPALTSADHLVEPLRYITTRNEYEEILSNPNRKDAVDLFWLNSAGNELRARTLIQKYYNGVQEANELFTSYHEGWKTDRGMIYIIFGKPDVVYRGIGQEEWIYGEPDNRNSIRFTFVQVQNPFTYNDYMLLRSPTLKDPWYIAVQSWRR